MAGGIDDYRQIPPKAFLYHGWDLIAEEQLFQIMRPFLKQQLQLAKEEMPSIYAQHLASIQLAQIRQREDWWSVPLLFKDDVPEYGIKGFR